VQFTPLAVADAEAVKIRIRERQQDEVSAVFMRYIRRYKSAKG